MTACEKSSPAPGKERSPTALGESEATRQPALSVIITSWNAGRTIQGCLDSLRAQETAAPFEVLLVDSSSDGTADLVRRHYPAVRVITSPSRLYCGEARNLGIPAARAAIIAFLDADCFVESDWVAALLAAHRTSGLLVTGSVENGTPRSLTAWAYYFCEFNLWLPREGERRMAEAPGCSLSFKRPAWERYGPFLTATYSSDTAFHWRARSDGQLVSFHPSIRVFHRALHGPREFLRHVVMHRRCYAQVMVRERRVGVMGRLARSLAAPALPVILLATVSARVIRSGRHRRAFLRCMPLLFAGLCARAWGEFLGFAWR